MKVILQKNVQALGKAGDVVEAKPGYYRNFLQPRGLAVLATGGAMKKREEDLAAVQKKSAEDHDAAVAIAQKITELGSIKLTAKAGEGGRLYGKITTKEIAQELTTAVSHEIDKRGIKLNDEITAIGTYRATVRVAADVQAEVSVEVSQQGVEAV